MRIGDVMKTAAVEGKEKHVPFLEVVKGEGGVSAVHVLVGKEVPHPNTVEHHIAWVELFGVKQDGQVVNLGRAEFAPAYTAPDAKFQVPTEQFKSLCAVEYCNVHGLWENCIEL